MQFNSASQCLVGSDEGEGWGWGRGGGSGLGVHETILKFIYSNNYLRMAKRRLKEKNIWKGSLTK